MDIRISDLYVRFGDKHVVDSLSLELSGRSVCIFGESGCGKSTPLNVIAGLIKPEAGSVSGIPARISYLFQDNRLLPWLNARENVETALAKKDHMQAEEWLLKMGLQKEDTEKLPAQLSGGMKRRVAIARALAFGGELLLLDEPLESLDMERKYDLLALIKEYTKEKSMILITHDIQQAEALCETIIRVAGPPLKDVRDSKLKLIKEVDQSDLKQALDLVNIVFSEFVAVDYSEQGQKTFEDYIKNKYEELSSDLTSMHKKIWACWQNGEIVGVIATRDTSHIALMFVDKRYHKKGIARYMFNHVLEETSQTGEITQMTVNSSPFAVEVYERLGFVKTAAQQEKDGIIYIPMVRPLTNHCQP